jgi:uncharacterized protein YlxW (UPF0749 family)
MSEPNIEQEIAKLSVKMNHVEQKVNDIDLKLENINISSRLAVLEDRQATVFKLIHGMIGVFGTIISGIVIWLFTR